MIDLAARALANADHARQRRESERERIQRENADLFAWRQQFLDMGGTSTYLRCEVTGRVWGERSIDRVRKEGGRGICVQASASPKPGKLLKERR